MPQISKNGLNQIKKCRKEEQILGYNEDEAIPPIMTIPELNAAIILATKIPVDEEADRYATYLARDMNFCLHAPMFTKTSVGDMKPGGELCKDCHFNTKHTVCQKLYGGSARIYFDLIKLSKAYAFWLQLPSVTKYLMRSIAVDVVNHRIVTLPNVVLKDQASYGDRRLFIKNNYVEWCWSKLQDRQPCEEAYTRLIEGNGSTSDLETIIAAAQEDLYPRIDMLPDMTVCDQSTLLGNLLSSPGFIYTYSCAENGYMDIMKKARTIETSAASADQKIEQLNKLLDTISTKGIPLDVLLVQQISVIIKAINLKDRITKTKVNSVSLRNVLRVPKKK